MISVITSQHAVDRPEAVPSPAMMWALLLLLHLLLLLGAAASVTAADDPRPLNVGSGPKACKFANGTRAPDAPLPAEGYFGPEPCVFASEMVLRANDSSAATAASGGAVIWGSATPGQSVVCAVDGSTVATAIANASGWEVTLHQPASAAARRTLTFMAGEDTVCDANSTRHGTCVTLSSVLFGDVFLCSGQSNMDFSVAPWGAGGCLAANETVAAAGKYNDGSRPDLATPVKHDDDSEATPSVPPVNSHQHIYNPVQMGADPNGKRDSTDALQKTIDLAMNATTRTTCANRGTFALALLLRCCSWIGF